MGTDNERWSGGKRLDAVLRVCAAHGLTPGSVTVSDDSVCVDGLAPEPYDDEDDEYRDRE